MTEAEKVPPILGTASFDLFSQDSVKELDSSDFLLDSSDKITIKWAECIIVLFYAQNRESKDLVKIFSLSAQQIPGTIMAGCNLMVKRKVAKAFTEVRTDEDHPYHWAGLKGYPFILVYRKGIPRAAYNGDRSVEAIVDWSTTLACKSGYNEHFISVAGVETENDYQMGPTNKYPGDNNVNPVRTKSEEYITGKPIRGYNPKLPISEQNSPLAQREEQLLEQAPPLAGSTSSRR